MNFSSDHTSLVTGASSGIGAATARRLAERGSHVAIHYRSQTDSATQIVDEIRASGGRAFAVQADLARADAAHQLMETVLSRMGHLDVVVNGAGSIVRRQDLVDISDDLWADVMETNLGSAFRVTRAAAPSMMERKSGAIINLGSVAGRNGGSLGIIPYAAAKAAVVCLTKGLAKDLIRFGIRVNCVNPGVIDTPFHDRFTSPQTMNSLLGVIPQGRAGTAEEIASVICFLAGAESSHIVGETIEVNGGMWMD